MPFALAMLGEEESGVEVDDGGEPPGGLSWPTGRRSASVSPESASSVKTKE